MRYVLGLGEAVEELRWEGLMMWKVEGEGEEGMVLGVEIARVPRRRFERWWPSPELEDPLGMRLESLKRRNVTQ